MGSEMCIRDRYSFRRLLFVIFKSGPFCLVVEKLDRFGVVVEVLEEVCEQSLVVSKNLHTLVIKINPYLNSIKTLKSFGGYKSKSIDSLRMIEVLDQQKEHQISVYLIFIVLSFIDREDEASSFLIFRIFPLGFNSFLEILHRIDTSGFVFDCVSKCEGRYSSCLLLF